MSCWCFPTLRSSDLFLSFFFNDTATTEIYTLSLHDALPISRNISRPVIALRNAAKKVGAGDLNQQVSISSNDEIGELGAAFNIMVDELADAGDMIKKKNETLQLQNEIIEQKNLDKIGRASCRERV